MVRAINLLLVLLVAVTNSHAAPSGPAALERNCAALARDKGSASERLHALFKLHWDYTLAEHPELATEVGYPGRNDRWTDLSPLAIEGRKAAWHAPLKVLQSIERAKLNPEDQLHYDLFQRNTEEAIRGGRFPDEYLQITQLQGPQLNVSRLMDVAPHRTSQDYEDILSRLKKVPRLIEQTIVLLNKGLAAGITPPRITLREVPQQVKNQLVADPAQNPLLKAFADFPAGISPAEQKRLRQAAAQALQQEVLPAFRKLHEFLTETYLPGARETLALYDLPDGKAWYAHKARTRTTTSLTPRQIHELGLAEVKRLRQEMDKVIAALGFKGSFEEFLQFLRHDSRFYYQDPASLLMAYRDICKRADPELPQLFGKLPRLPYGVRPVPAQGEKSQPTGYYQAGSLAVGRAAYFYANTYALATRPKWEMEALALHEAVPGHHLQISLAQEMEDAPEFRKHGGYTAFSEGWGLYAESLGYEMGFYKDPYMKFGQLTYEMWRAIRLVVDTGLHAFGWSRSQAIAYFLANAGKNEHDVTVEVDRYLVWPGQALAYKIGQLKIKELREYARQELGERYNIRAFHDEVLGKGALPLDILEKRIEEWVGKEKTRG